MSKSCPKCGFTDEGEIKVDVTKATAAGMIIKKDKDLYLDKQATKTPYAPASLLDIQDTRWGLTQLLREAAGPLYVHVSMSFDETVLVELRLSNDSFRRSKLFYNWLHTPKDIAEWVKEIRDRVETKLKEV